MKIKIECSPEQENKARAIVFNIFKFGFWAFAFFFLSLITIVHFAEVMTILGITAFITVVVFAFVWSIGEFSICKDEEE